MKVGILGGSLAGLAAANFLKHDFEVLEKTKSTVVCAGACGKRDLPSVMVGAT